VLEPLRSNAPLRRLILAWLQSCVGTGAGYVALLLLTYRHLHTSWGVSAVLLAEFVPAIVLGSWFGLLADRHSKRALIVGANIMQAAAYLALATATSGALIIALALLAGVGNALQRPAMRASITLVAGEASQGAAALFSTSRWIGVTVGPLLAAGLLLITGLAVPLALNGLSFVVACVVIATVPIAPLPADGADADDARSRGILAGLREAFGSPGIGWLIACSAGQVIGGGLLNVCEPIYATHVLRGSGSDYAALVTCYGGGMVIATTLVARRGNATLRVLVNRYIASLALMAAGMVGSAIVGSVALAAWTFAATGYGNGLLAVTETQVILLRVASRVQGRLFGTKDMIEGIFFLTGLVAAAPLIALMGVRATLYEGAAVCAICAGAALLGLRGLRIAAADARVDPEGTDIGASHDAAGHLHADAAAITPAAPPQALR
jgi:hypothetical protein